MSGRPPHSVLLRGRDKIAHEIVATALAKRRSGVAPEEMLLAARNAWGLVAEGLPAEEAEELAAELTAAGQDAVAVPATLVEPLPEPVPATRIDLVGDGLDIVTAKEVGRRERLSWNALRVICAGEIETLSFKTVTDGPSLAERAVRMGVAMATGIPVGGTKSSERKVEEPRRLRIVELAFWDPPRRVRIAAEEFDYSILGAEMGYSAEMNFPLLIARLRDAAPRALRGRGTRAFLGDAPRPGIRYESLEDLAREERWLLALAVLDPH